MYVSVVTAKHLRIPSNMIESCQKPDMENAFRVFLTYFDDVMGLAIRFAPCSDLADDIAQEVFSCFVQEYDNEDDSDTQILLYRLTRRIAQRHYHRKMQTMPEALRKIGEFMARQGRTVTEPAQYRSEIEAMKDCLERLPMQSREVIDLHYFENVPLTDIAKRKGIRSGTLRQIMTRIRRKLKECVMLAMQPR